MLERKLNIDVSDEAFNLIYGQSMQEIADIHFTPLEITKIAAEYLADKPSKKVLDIGSGAGKFCMVGSVFTKGYFTGVELRPHLHAIAVELSNFYDLQNIDFLCSNITDIDFKNYEAFYIFNAFYENICIAGRIDNDIDLNKARYDLYSMYVKTQLESMPIGTKLVTYFSYSKEIPDNYELLFGLFDDKLKFWKKMA
jgi:SAM-dependent methyltransferase